MYEKYFFTIRKVLWVIFFPFFFSFFSFNFTSNVTIFRRWILPRISFIVMFIKYSDSTRRFQIGDLCFFPVLCFSIWRKFFARSNFPGDNYYFIFSLAWNFVEQNPLWTDVVYVRFSVNAHREKFLENRISGLIARTAHTFLKLLRKLDFVSPRYVER